MARNNPSNREDSGLDQEDFRRIFLVENWKYALHFVLILVILSGLLFWFQSRMRANSDKKINQVRTILMRAKNLPRTPTPLTAELEGMARKTNEERNRIIRGLMADSFPKHFKSQLRNRYLTSKPVLELPENWQGNLPPNLRQWSQSKRRKRRQEINQFLDELKSTLRELEYRMKRVRTFRQNRNLKAGWFGGDVKRYTELKSTLNQQMEDVRRQLKKTTINSPSLPNGLYREVNDLIDPMTLFAMHLRNFSAFSSAPSAYYHADRLLHDALRIDPENPAAYYLLGRVYRQLGLHNVASENMIRALRYNPNFKRKQILENLLARLKNEPDNPRRNYNLGFAFHELGQDQKAKKYLKKTLRLLRGQQTMVKVLARKRLNYIRHGEPPYSKLTLF